MNWTLEQARALVESLEPTVSGYGFLLSVYGSVMRRGHGRDLDLILAQKRINASPHEALNAIAQVLHAEMVVEPTKSLFANLCALMRLPDGRLIDIQVRLSALRDALELYESGVMLQ